MASELSRFIEDELKKQGIQDDEEQRLLSNLRVKPLAVQSPPQTGSRWTWKNRLVFLGLLAVALVGLVALLATLQGGTGQYESGWKGVLTEPEAGTVPVGSKNSTKEQSRAKDQSPAQQAEEEAPPADQAKDQSSKSKDEDYEDDYDEEGEVTADQAQQAKQDGDAAEQQSSQEDTKQEPQEDAAKEAAAPAPEGQQPISPKPSNSCC